MVKGRSSAIMMGTAVLVGSLLLLLLHGELELAEAAETHMVGDEDGWTFGVSDWPKGKQFKAGDTLVFKYNRFLHNVVAVDEAGYKSCSKASGGKVFETGEDRIRLLKGQNFFICTVTVHCRFFGMKIAINAV